MTRSTPVRHAEFRSISYVGLGPSPNPASPPEKLFHFRHGLEDGRCPARTRGGLSQEEIDAHKYNVANESELHRQMKEWIAQCLRADSQFSDVAVEARWRSALTGEWRKPDVRAKFRGTPVEFPSSGACSCGSAFAGTQGLTPHEHWLKERVIKAADIAEPCRNHQLCYALHWNGVVGRPERCRFAT